MYYDLDSFGKVVRQIRKTLGYTQKDVSDLSYLTTETLRKVENGKVLPNHVTLDILSYTLKVDLNQLLLNYRTCNKEEPFNLKDQIELKNNYRNQKCLEETLLALSTMLKYETLSSDEYNLIKQLTTIIVQSIETTINTEYPTSLKYLADAIQSSILTFDIDKYDQFVYNNVEMDILANIAICKFNSTQKCQEILEFCLKSLDMKYVDLKLSILYNLSCILYKINELEKSLSYSSEGIKLCIANNSLSFLALLYLRKGISQYFLENNDFIDSFKNAVNIYELTIIDNT